MLNLVKEGLKGRDFNSIIVGAEDLEKAMNILEENGIKCRTIDETDSFVAKKTIKKFKKFGDYNKVEEERLNGLVKEMTKIIDKAHFNTYGEYPEMEAAIEEIVEENYDILEKKKNSDFEW
jgi:hypothetical protein